MISECFYMFTLNPENHKYFQVITENIINITVFLNEDIYTDASRILLPPSSEQNTGTNLFTEHEIPNDRNLLLQ
jgi:hypothetical protein